MKSLPKFLNWSRWTALGLIAAGSLAVSQAQTFTNIVISQFDTASDPFSQLYVWWGGPVFAQSWDSTENNTTTLAPNNPGSGALKLTADWSAVNSTGGPQPQLMLWNAFSGIEWNQNITASGYYYDVNFDIKFDPTSGTTANGDFGHLQAFVTDAGWNRIQVWDNPAFTNSGWTHIHGYIDPAQPGADTITGFCLYWPWQTGANNLGAITNTQTVWLDNIILNTNLTKPLAPPTMTLKPAPPPTPGLNITSVGAAQYDRNNIATVNSESWVSASGPVTYSLTISKYPGTNYPSYQTQIFLTSNPGTESDPDWNEPNVIFLDIENQANGSAVANLRYKTNQPGANAMYYGSGALGSITSTNGPLGTWSMTFANITNVTLNGPGGISTNLSFPDEQALFQNFPDSVIAYFGAQPNTTADIGQGIVLSNVKITGTAMPINDSFAGSAVDTNTWVLRATQPKNVFIPTSDIAFNLSWTLPDLHFILQAAANVNGPWTDLNLTNTSIFGPTKVVPIPKSALPSTSSSYFRMVKPVATQLQVLMPGETNAPASPTGKIGTPLAQVVGAPVTVTVNAVDSHWNIINYVTDTVAITTTDSSATLPNPAALVAGTQTFTVNFGTTGTFTVTATDTSDATKAPNTGSPTTVTP